MVTRKYFKDLLIDGIFKGVGGVLVFLPTYYFYFFLLPLWKIPDTWQGQLL
jgi:Fe2+ transport system protein B